MDRAGKSIRRTGRQGALLAVALLAACSGYDGRPQTGGASPDPGGVPSPAPQADAHAIDLVRGEMLYQDLCAHCHGADARGGRGWPSLRDANCLSCGAYMDLWQTIEATMPWRAAGQCDRRCARDVAAWLVNDLSATPTCTVDFEYTQITMQDFSATVRIANRRGLDIETWTLAWTPDPGQRIMAIDGGSIEQRASDLLFEPLPDNARIVDGSEVLVTLLGTHEGVNTVPDDLRLEAPPCFAAAPADSNDSAD